MTKAFFSIIIPTLNEENYIGNLCSDLEGQEEKDFEVIVVDGGSKDKTLELLKTFKNSFPLTIIPARETVFTARNRGAKEASGEYVVFFDADIRINTLFLKQLRTKLHALPADFAFCRGIPDNKNIFDHTFFLLAMMLVWFSALVSKPLMSAQCLIFKRQVFEAIKGFDETLVHAEDHELVRRAHLAGFKGRVFLSPYHRMSFRRFEREGRIVLFGKYFRSTLHVLFKGPIREPLFTYEMGGDAKKS